MFDDFLNNPVIQNLAQKPYWTINVDGKKPLDIVEFSKTGTIRGAFDDKCLVTLSDLISILNGVPQQLTYKLDAVRDNFVVLDIEKTCPDAVKSYFLTLPFLYGDISLSGKGYHMVFPCPELDEITSKKLAMQEPHKYYELLLAHFVTFMPGNMITPQFSPQPASFEYLWQTLRDIQKSFAREELQFNADDIKLDFPEYEKLKTAVKRSFENRFRKTPATYNDDMSRYEFAVIGALRLHLLTQLDLPAFNHLKLDVTQQIMIVYQITTEIVSYRAKHDTMRNGKPFLLYQTYNSFVTKKE